MGLDFRKTAPQVREMGLGLRQAHEARQSRLDLALRTLADPLRRPSALLLEDVFIRRVEAAGPPRPRVTFLVAGLPFGEVPASRLAQAHPAAAPPSDYIALATDGSQIAPDRHGPVHCFLINAGGAAIRYGAQPGAALFNEPRLFHRAEEMVIADPPEAGVRQQPIDEVLLGVKRTVMELELLADRLSAGPPDLPVLALVDGSLVRWELSGSRYPDHVRRELLQDGYLRALDRMRALSRERRLAFAGYISSPRSTEVVNVLRVAWCPHEGLETRGCDNICGRGGPGQRQCDEVAAGLLDRDLFARLLRPGERSETFASQSAIVREYGPHEVRFCYVHVGDEVVRLEVPEWVADDAAAVDLLHALVLDQCRKGRGYPVVLQEAHEAAVVTESDRSVFWELVDGTLVQQRVAASESYKARSKRTRAV